MRKRKRRQAVAVQRSAVPLFHAHVFHTRTTCSRSRMQSADKQSQSSARRRAVAVERTQTCGRSRAHADVQSQSNAERRQAVAVERAQTTSSRPSHACATPSVPSHEFPCPCSRTQTTDAHAVDRPTRARPPSVPSNKFSCPHSRTHRRTDERAPCTRLCPACLIAQLSRKSVTDTPRATRVHMPACTLAVQLAFL